MVGSYSNSDSDFNLTQPAALNQKTNPAMIENKARKNLLPLGDLEDEISDEAARKRVQQEKISNYVAKNPVDAAKLINAWLHAEEF